MVGLPMWGVLDLGRGVVTSVSLHINISIRIAREVIVVLVVASI